MAVVTGGGTGMGRELVRQLAAAGCHVAMCDVNPENMAETEQLALSETTHSVRVTSHICDVADEVDVIAFRDQLQIRHQIEHVDLVFNNAGIAGGAALLQTKTVWRGKKLSTSAGTASTTEAELSYLC